MIVVIPAYCETNILLTLESLVACKKPKSEVEVIIVFNAGSHEEAKIKIQNEKNLKSVDEWIKHQESFLVFHTLNFPDLPKKHAGVGLGRKIGMDEAVDRFEQVEQENGLIVCLDADSIVSPNYLCAIEEHFEQHKKTQAASIHFEHPLEGEAFPPEVYTAITLYELFLRYYIEGLRYAGHPHAYHTIGSSMAVRQKAYEAQGGMNRRKAGEDFYFLHKFIQLDQLSELNSTCVYPSPRPAENVPFGTGKAVKQWLTQEDKTYQAYAFETFIDLKQFIDLVPELYRKIPENLPDSINEFFEHEKFWSKHLIEIRAHVSSELAFVKRFFRWFNGLKVLQYVHYARDHHHPLVDLMNVCSHLVNSELKQTPQEYLKYLRYIQGEEKSANFTD